MSELKSFHKVIDDGFQQIPSFIALVESKDLNKSDEEQIRKTYNMLKKAQQDLVDILDNDIWKAPHQEENFFAFSSRIARQASKTVQDLADHNSGKVKERS